MGQRVRNGSGSADTELGMKWLRPRQSSNPYEAPGCQGADAKRSVPRNRLWVYTAGWFRRAACRERRR
jgi:hypothetical protein